jgi:AraC-like DNA-binding protein
VIGTNDAMTNLEAVKAVALRHAGSASTAFPRLSIRTLDRPTDFGGLTYVPVVCLVLQGAKRTVIGDQVLDYGAGSCMVVAAEVVAIGQISEASPEAPYLAANLYLDPAVISALLLEMSDMREPPIDTGFRISKAGPELLDVWRRLIGLLDRPHEIPVMAHHLEHELMFRLLKGPQGALLRQIAGTDSRLSHVRRAMRWIREHFAEHLSIDVMATVASMSVSVFHRHFKAVTGLTPLQYQKHVRLNEARRRLVSEHGAAATVGFSVGYESASQFSREYKRLFGASPRRDADMVHAIVDLGP